MFRSTSAQRSESDGTCELCCPAFPVVGRRRARPHRAESPRAQEPADVRIVRGAARSVPRPGGGAGGESGHRQRRRRQLLLRRRRARDHRSADEDGHDGPARIHAHDRRSRQSDARLSAADRRCSRRCLRRRRRDHRDGQRPARRHRTLARLVPVQSRRPRRLRHGCVRDPAANHRTRARSGAPVSRSLHEWRRGAAMGVLQSARCTRAIADSGNATRAGDRVRAVVRQRHHEDDAAPGVEHEHRSGDRSRSAGPGAVHADRGFPARLSRVRGKTEAAFQGNYEGN